MNRGRPTPSLRCHGFRDTFVGAAWDVSRGVFAGKRPKTVRDTLEKDEIAVSRMKNEMPDQARHDDGTKSRAAKWSVNDG